MNYCGDYDVGAIVKIFFNTFDSNDPSESVTMSAFANTDVHIFKDDSLTQRTNAAGITVDIDVDTYAGVHKITIDTANNTVNDFFEAGHDYAVIIEGVTVDAGTLNPVVGTFSIANRRVAGQMCVSSIEGLASQTSFTLTAGEASGDDDAYNGCTIIVTDQVTKIQKAVGHILDYTGASRTVTLHAAPLQTNFTMAIADSVEIFATAAFANVNTVVQTVQTANDNGADINAILVDTDTMEADLTTEINANETKIDAVKADTAAILVDTDTMEADLTTEINANETKIDAVKADTAAILVDTDTMEADLVAALPDAAAINAEVLDVVNIDTFAEPGQVNPPAAPTIRQMLHHPYKRWRNKRTSTNAQKSYFNDAGAVVDQKRAISDGGATYSEDEVVTGP